MIDRQTILDRLRVIILALLQRAAAHIADALFFRGDIDDVIAGAAAFADTPSAHAGDDLLIGDLDGDHGVESDTCLLQSLGLGDGAGHAVQNVAVGTVRLLQTLVDDADDDLIGHQLTGIHILLGLQPGGRTVLHSRPQDIAGGDGGDVQLLLDDVCLRALTGTRSA